MKSQLTISCLEHETNFYKFWKPIIFTLEKICEIDNKNISLHLEKENKEYVWVCHNSEIGIFSFSEKFGDILNELCEDFDYIYREIVLEDDKKLDEKARIVKQKILNLLA